MRALLVGGAPSDAARLAARLGAGASVICFAADRATGETLKSTIASTAPGARVSVMIGDPWLLLHKVSGPFDLIVLPSGAGGASASATERIGAVLGEGGELDG